MKKEQLEKLVHRKLLWHEYTDKGTYIEGGLCCNANPVRIMVRTSGNSYENIESKGFVKCDGVRDFEPIEKFDDGKICLSCPNRQASCFSAADAVPTSAFNIDLTARNEGRLVSTHQVIVPSGCPHSLGEPAEQGRKGKEVAASLVGSWNEKDTVPFSWKIVENGDKLTLSIQYRSHYMDVEKMRMVSKSLYCHLSCNLANGQTYISDLHTEHSRYRTGVVKAQMESLTFTGRSALMTYMPSYEKLQPAVERLLSHLRDKIRAQGFDISPTCGAIPKEWNVPFPMTHRTIHDTIREIAVTNRFPTLGTFPLDPSQRMFLPLYLKRRFDKLPRDVTRQNLCECLKVDGAAKAAKAVEEEPSLALYPVMLDEWGFTSEDIDAFSENQFERVNNRMRLVAGSVAKRNSYDMFDMCSLLMPVFLLSDEEVKRFDTSWILEQVFGADMDEVVKSLMRSALEEQSATYTKNKKRWRADIESVDFCWKHPLVGMSMACVSLSAADESMPSLSVLAQLYLDRRAYNKKEARRYVSFVKMLSTDDSNSNDSTDNVSAADGFDSTDGIDNAANVASDVEPMERERAHMLDVITRAIRFSFSLGNVEQRAHRLLDERTCRIVYEWAYKSDIEIQQKLDRIWESNTGRRARLDIEKRKEKARDKRREERKQKKSEQNSKEKKDACA